jgi:transposase
VFRRAGACAPLIILHFFVPLQTVVVDGPNRQSFLPYIEQFLIPTLKAGAIVILDNLGSQRVRR